MSMGMLRGSERVGQVKLPEPSEGETGSYVLDGRQRLTSLDVGRRLASTQEHRTDGQQDHVGGAHHHPKPELPNASPGFRHEGGRFRLVHEEGQGAAAFEICFLGQGRQVSGSTLRIVSIKRFLRQVEYGDRQYRDGNNLGDEKGNSDNQHIYPRQCR